MRRSGLIPGIGTQLLEFGRDPDVLEESAVLLVGTLQPVDRRLLLAGLRVQRGHGLPITYCVRARAVKVSAASRIAPAYPACRWPRSSALTDSASPWAETSRAPPPEPPRASPSARRPWKKVMVGPEGPRSCAGLPGALRLRRRTGSRRSAPRRTRCAMGATGIETRELSDLPARLLQFALRPQELRVVHPRPGVASVQLEGSPELLLRVIQSQA